MAIVWLASFPKSGNTWARALLANYLVAAEKPLALDRLGDLALADATLKPYEIAAGRPLPNITLAELMPLKAKAHGMIANSKSGAPVLAKTHSALRLLHGHPTITPAATAAAIYVLRNPLDVALSYADHFGHTLADAVDAMASPSLMTQGRADRAPEYLGDWSSHVRGWTQAKGLAKLLVRYEDMEADAERELIRMLKFLRIDIDADRVARAAGNSTFEALSTQEAMTGFRERSKSQKRFFRAGKSGQWRDGLPADLIQKTVAAHGAVMREHGYLDGSGQPI